MVATMDVDGARVFSVELKGVAQFLMPNTVLMLGLEMGDVSAP